MLKYVLEFKTILEFPMWRKCFLDNGVEYVRIDENFKSVSLYLADYGEEHVITIEVPHKFSASQYDFYKGTDEFLSNDEEFKRAAKKIIGLLENL